MSKAKKKYKILVLGITGRNGQFYRNNTKVADEETGYKVVPTILTEDQLEETEIGMLLKGGYIEEYVPKSKKPAGDKEAEKQKLVNTYLEISGEESVPGTWGIPKLTEEIEKAAKAKADARAAADEEE